MRNRSIPPLSMIVIGLIVIGGCNQVSVPKHYPVAGVVKQGNKAIQGARVLFIPQGETQGNGGDGTTDASGSYQITAFHSGDQKGLPAGTYKVVITRMLQPDGTPLPPDVPPIESNASETIPEPYCNPRDTPLSTSVDATEKRYDFDLMPK